MSFDDFRHIFDQIRPARLNLTGYGESLLNPDLGRMLEYAKSQGAEHVRFFTNGTRLTKEMIELLVRLRIDCVNFSIDGETAELYASIRSGASLETVLSNIDSLIEYRASQRARRPAIGIKFVLMAANLSHASSFLEMCDRRYGGDVHPEFLMLEAVDQVEIAGMIPTANRINLNYLADAAQKAESFGYLAAAINLRHVIAHLGEKYTPRGEPCFHPLYNLMVTIDGNVIPCQLHYNEQVVFGNMFQQSIQEIWDSHGYITFREQIGSSRADLPYCSACTDAEEAQNIYGGDSAGPTHVTSNEFL